MFICHWGTLQLIVSASAVLNPDKIMLIQVSNYSGSSFSLLLVGAGADRRSQIPHVVKHSLHPSPPTSSNQCCTECFTNSIMGGSGSIEVQTRAHIASNQSESNFLINWSINGLFENFDQLKKIPLLTYESPFSI